MSHFPGLMNNFLKTDLKIPFEYLITPIDLDNLDGLGAYTKSLF